MTRSEVKGLLEPSEVLNTRGKQNGVRICSLDFCENCVFEGVIICIQRSINLVNILLSLSILTAIFNPKSPLWVESSQATASYPKPNA